MGHRGFRQGACTARAFRLGDVLNGHIHQLMQRSKATSPSIPRADGTSAARARHCALARSESRARR
jgi:hypothetical protein